MATSNLLKNEGTLFHSKYKLAETNPICTGSFSTVYLIEDIKSKNKFAMKALLTSRFVKSKSEEIRIMSKLNSPFTIRYIEAFQEGIMLCIVMEYCQNGDLANKIFENRIKNQKFHNDIIQRWSSQMINGLYYLHSNNVMHRSINPGNILLSLELNAKIADFGDAVIVGESDLLNEVASSFKYTSPEMRELIKNYSFNTDIWSVGCIIFEMITLEPYYDYEKTIKSTSKSNACELPYLNEATEILNKLLKMMLKHDHEQRCETHQLMLVINDIPSN